MYKFKPEFNFSDLVIWLFSHAALSYAIFAIVGSSLFYVFGGASFQGYEIFERATCASSSRYS